MKSAHRASCFAVHCLLGACTQPSLDDDLARAVIGPGGGTITSRDSVLTIAILPGALEQEIELFVAPSDEPPDIFGQAYLVRPAPELLIDATISIRAELPDDLDRVAVGAVDPDEFASRTGSWEPLPVLQVDDEQQLVVGLDDRISIFYGLLDDGPGQDTTDEPMDDPTAGGSTSGSPNPGDTGGETTGDAGGTTGSGPGTGMDTDADASSGTSGGSMGLD
ncbi:MAG: hypothetical protein AB1Z98_03935 [Nannocystaceae bacterium]